MPQISRSKILPGGFVSGHGFSRAAKPLDNDGFSRWDMQHA